MTVEVRRAEVADARAMAGVHVEAWRDAFRGLVPDARLDDPDAVVRRHDFWRRLLVGDVSIPFAAETEMAVATADDVVVGFGSAGPAKQIGAPRPRQLYTLYLLDGVRGTGVAPALVDRLLGEAPALVWVVEQNERARRFYRRLGFAEDGATVHDDGFDEVRMVR